MAFPNLKQKENKTFPKIQGVMSSLKCLSLKCDFFQQNWSKITPTHIVDVNHYNTRDYEQPELADSSNINVSHVYLKKNILQAVKQLFGEEGTKSVIDVLKYNVPERRFVLRCDSDFYIKLRASLTVAGQFEGKQCVYIVHRASPNLLSFVGDSRNYNHE